MGGLVMLDILVVAPPKKHAKVWRNGDIVGAKCFGTTMNTEYRICVIRRKAKVLLVPKEVKAVLLFGEKNRQLAEVLAGRYSRQRAKIEVILVSEEPPTSQVVTTPERRWPDTTKQTVVKRIYFGHHP